MKTKIFSMFFLALILSLTAAANQTTINNNYYNNDTLILQNFNKTMTAIKENKFNTTSVLLQVNRTIDEKLTNPMKEQLLACLNKKSELEVQLDVAKEKLYGKNES